MATVAAFPTPDTTGLLYAKYDMPVAEYGEVTYDQTFEDKSRATNAVTNTAPQRWRFTFDGLLEHEAKIWRDHYALAFHDLNDFPYIDFSGTLYTGVKYSKFDCDPDETGGWFKITIELVKYP